MVLLVLLPSHIATKSHFQQSSLIQSTRVDIDSMTIRGSSRREEFIMFRPFLHIFRVILLNVVMRSNGMFQLVVHHLARTLGARTTTEK